MFGHFPGNFYLQDWSEMFNSVWNFTYLGNEVNDSWFKCLGEVSGSKTSIEDVT